MVSRAPSERLQAFKWFAKNSAQLETQLNNVEKAVTAADKLVKAAITAIESVQANEKAVVTPIKNLLKAVGGLPGRWDTIDPSIHQTFHSRPPF